MINVVIVLSPTFYLKNDEKLYFWCLLFRFQLLTILFRKKIPLFEATVKRMVPLPFYISQHRVFICEYGSLCTSGEVHGKDGPSRHSWIEKNPAFQ